MAPLALVAVWLAADLALVPGTARAQAARSSFPGRRIGGGTRDACTSRLLVHLVPESSVYAAAEPQLLGLLQGPVLEPMVLELAFSPYASEASPSGSPSPQPQNRVLAPTPAGVTLLQLAPQPGPTLWSSHYRCETAPRSGDPLAFAVTTAPPALSLLLPEADTTAADRSVREALAQLKKSCGGSVAREELARSFGLEDLLAVGWPAQLPVRCL